MSSIQTRQVRPLGGGLRSVELDITATGPAGSGLALFEWVAINRKAIRLASATAAPVEDATVLWTLTLLAIVA